MVIVIKDINYNEIIKNIVESLKDAIKAFIETANYDKTFKARVVKKISNDKYQVVYRGQKHTVTSDVELQIDQIVYVCIPQNDWSDLFVVKVGKTWGQGNNGIVTGVKGENEKEFRSGNVNISKDNLGIGNVENKSSEAIRNEITANNITNALGYSPAASSHSHDDRYYTEHEVNVLLNGKSPSNHLHDSLYSGNYRVALQGDGNLVIYRLSDNHVVWSASGTHWNP